MAKRILRRSRHTWLSVSHWRRRIIFWAGAISVGVAAYLFAAGSEYANLIFHKAVTFSPYLPLIITPVGLASVVYITRRFFEGSEGSGIPQTIAALHMKEPGERNAILSLRIAAGKVILTLLALMSGASVGREGPTVQIGAAIMHALGKFGRFSRADMEKSLILAGGAAGVAAAFNTPLAGIVFAIEEMSRSFEQRASGTVLTTVIVAGITSIALSGNYVYFGHTADTIGFVDGWVAIVACGLVGGLLGGGFSRILILGMDIMPQFIRSIAMKHPVRFAAICGFILAVLGLLSGSTVYGTGYAEARQILEHTAELPQGFGLMKLLATLVSYLSGIPGGIFAPSLAVGAGLGGNIAALFPYLPAGAIITLGMVAYFTGVVQAPITAFVIVMEMTDNHDFLIPLMATAAIAQAASRVVCPTPLYKAIARKFIARSSAKQDAQKLQEPT
ncbi:chloride channel protein [Sulfurirhabdus autotrophica]|uniref:H+/Cl-antiporter ClcA n=1 Tax=Sulfurirhabdus autotrophica TaxID=1706046 RepID=A0A4R3XZ13_9PROT|nr:chloride channel protein [Sulfurirhabdus autotrophica]TCV84151.1 H+/Cl- antiporter ClcA [Sulfurirhabdus autotrophica]